MTSLNAVTQVRRVLTVLGVAVVLLLVRPAGAADEYPALGFFLDGLTERSSWNEILAKPGMKPDFPFVGFGPTFVPPSSVCVDGQMLAISDPRIDTGVRVSAEGLREQVRAAAAAGGYVAEPGSQVATTMSPNTPSQTAMQYPVSVYKVTERGFMRQWVFLFDKRWPIPACPAK
jgi:hypothetical protein